MRYLLSARFFLLAACVFFLGCVDSLTASPTPTSTFGEEVTFTATVSGPSPPTALVTFTDQLVTAPPGAPSPIPSCTELSANADGVYVCRTRTLSVGTHTIRARSASGGDTGPDGADNTITHNVVPTLTATLATSRNPSDTGESVTFTATLDTLGGPPASGSGTFRDIFGGSAVVLGTVGVGGSQAQITTSALATGQHTIEFIYNGDGTYPPGATASLGQLVTAANSNLTLSSSPNPSAANQPVTLVATLQVSSTSPPPSGRVTFSDGSVILGEAEMSGNTATLTTTALTTGTHTLTATYANDPNTAPSTASSTHIVGKGSTALTLTSSASTTTRGQNVIFRARVTSPAGFASGTVRFSTQNSSLGSSTLDGSGVATFSTSGLAPGRHEITATYDGDPRLNGSTGTIVHNVTALVATVTVEASPNPSRAGEAVTITATVTSTVGTPSGSVSFLSGSGAPLGSAPLSATGVATFTTTTLPVGVSNLIAHYDGGGFYPSGSGATEHVVGKANTSIQLSSSPNPSAPGAAVTFTGTITADAPVAITGSVEVFDGATSVGIFPIVDTTATFTTTALTPGEHTIRVAYPGNDQLNGSEAALAHTVNAATGASSSGSSGSSGASGGSAGAGQGGVGGGAITAQGGSSDDDGCSVAAPGAPSSPRAFVLLALACLVAARRRRAA